MGRSPCCATHSVLNRGPWTAQENLILGNYISIHGEGRWKALPKNAGLNRCGKSCRLRWLNYLRPDIKRGNISPDEEELIIRMHKLLGNRWSLIAGRLPGRTDNEIKNYWNTHLSKTRVPEKETIPQPHTPHTKSKRGPIEGRIAKRRKIYVDSGDSDHQALRSSDVTEEVKASKSCCDIVNPAITENICDSMENIYELNVDDGPFQQSQQYSENEEGTSHLLKENLSCWESMESNYELKIDNCPLKHSLHYSENNYELSVDDGLFQHSQNYSEKEVGKSHALKENLSCCECDMVFSPCNDFILKEFVQRPSDEFEQMCSLESLWQGGAMSDEW